jgi:threonine dehydrogenase-like Zn-dependent dehydrogenase
MRATDLTRAADLAAAGRVDLEQLITTRFGLEDGEAAFKALAERQGLKVVVQP